MSSAPFLPSSLKSAGYLIVAGLALQAAQVAIVVIAGYYLARVGFLTSILFILGISGVAWLVLVLVFSYLPLRAGRIDRARTPTLIFAILSIFTISILAGLMYVLAYHEMRPQAPPGPPPRPLGSPPPLAGGSASCSICGRANQPGSTFCQGCGFAIH